MRVGVAEPFGRRARLCYALLWLVAGSACPPRPSPRPSTMRRHRVELRIEKQLPSLPVEVAGETHPLMLDLGDGRPLTLAPEIVERAGLAFTGRKLASLDAMGNELVAREFEVPTLRVGDFRAGPVRGFEDVQDPSYPSPNPFGSVGRSLFGDGSALLVDYPRGQLEILVDPPELGPCVPVRLEDFGLVSDLATEGGELRVLWDTGAQASMIRSPDADPSAQEVAPRRLRLPAGEEEVPFIAFPFEQPPVDAYLGYDFFAKHAVLFDVGRGCVVIDPEL